jgi:hypothetical protein
VVPQAATRHASANDEALNRHTLRAGMHE